VVINSRFSGRVRRRPRRIRLGTSISSVFVRSAPTIGMAAATLDQLSNGRFILGLGSSHRVQVEPEHGISVRAADGRGSPTRSRSSARWCATASSRIAARRSPSSASICVSSAAIGDRHLRGRAVSANARVAGQLADGVLLTWPTPRAIARAVEHVAIGARRAGRRCHGGRHRVAHSVRRGR